MEDKRMSLVLPSEVHASFVGLCEKLRSMGATRVEAFGCAAWFGPPGAPPVPRKEPPETPRLTGEALELQARAQKLLGGSR